MDGLGAREIVVPGLGRLQAGLLQNVLAVVDHLEVAIDRQQLGLAADLLAEFAEVGRDVSQVDLGVLGDIGVQVFEQAGCVKFHAPAGGEDADVDGVRARRPVGLDLLEDFGERHFGHDDLGARGCFEFLATLDQTAGDDVARPRQNIDGDAVKLAGEGNRVEPANGNTCRQRAHHHFLK